MDKSNEEVDVNEQEIPFRLLPQEEQQRILDANQKKVREAPILQDWNIRVSTPFAWLIIFLVTAVMTLFAVGCVLLTGDVDWGFAYLAFGVAIAMIPYFRYLVMADKNYHYRLTTEGVIVTYQDVIPEVAYTIVRGSAWLGVVVCVFAVAVLGPFSLVGAGGMALLAIFFTDFKSEVTEHETMFKKDWDYTLIISNKKKALRFESTPFKISYSDNLYCKSEDFEKVVGLIKEQIRCVDIKYIKGHPMT
ncbi:MULTISPECIES: hypothetical protein [Aeromonas]|uniref:hypothetical protein n=1 Tax=Aeromonas TaxID=642 RepID=UPI000DA40033|nr:hypothetical protein [Aeromonas caviae]MBS4636876.1 hypothetical protein [Aeromonas caviae]WQD90141.1 hypothetical protein U0022_05360 [Aeromonas caviae]SQH58641.1 Uncharacterised protein [Aeromonas caviae]